jgi:hypothetical protein
MDKKLTVHRYKLHQRERIKKERNYIRYAMNETILITGASGNLGSKVAYELIPVRIPLKVAGRTKDKLAQFEGKAEVLSGSLEDEAFLSAALKNVQAVFLVLPQLQQLTTKEFAELFLRTAEEKGVTHVVNISNCTLKRYDQWTSLLEFEQYLNTSTQLHIKHLRCANFFENLNWGIHTPYHPAIKLPYISSYEIAHTAASYLRSKNFTGKSVEELMGKEDYSMQDFANMLGVTYQQQPTSPENSWFFDAFNTGQYELVQRTSENTSSLQEERFSLDYFLTHHLKQEALNATI